MEPSVNRHIRRAVYDRSKNNDDATTKAVAKKAGITNEWHIHNNIGKKLVSARVAYIRSPLHLRIPTSEFPDDAPSPN